MRECWLRCKPAVGVVHSVKGFGQVIHLHPSPSLCRAFFNGIGPYLFLHYCISSGATFRCGAMVALLEWLHAEGKQGRGLSICCSGIVG
jgi:hypothetical protein